MKGSKYVSKKPDANGICHYTELENETWNILYNRQINVVENRACDEFIDGLKLLNMSPDRIPQLSEITESLQKTTGWAVEPVPALIPSKVFFSLLANRKFPAATFIRTREELDYLQEPDIFHELFGHCPLLTHQNYANFVEAYGKLSLQADSAKQKKLLRLFWFTIEFGLVESPKGTRIYGGGILSSKEETIYALESELPERLPFTITDALLTPYRINIKQPIYYTINNLDTLFDILNPDIMTQVQKSNELDDYEPKFKLE